jgi:hypothetical protein
MSNELKNAVAQLDGLVGDIKGMVAEPVAKPVELTLIQKLLAIADGTSAPRGGFPLATVSYYGKTFGVFWKGEGKPHGRPTVGLRKLVMSGRLHKGHRRFAPAKWVEITELAAHGN